MKIQDYNLARDESVGLLHLAIAKIALGKLSSAQSDLRLAGTRLAIASQLKKKVRGAR